MKHFLIQCLLLALVATAAAQVHHQASPHSSKPQPVSCVQIQDATFHSPSLDRQMKYRILLPCAYNAGSGRFPVLYLLHGLYGNYLDWDTKTDLEHYAQSYALIVVMPDAGDSWYTNSATDPKDKFEDYIAKDLVAEIDGKFRTLRSHHARAIAGLSMGGYGSLKIALRDHNNFAFAGSLSGALDAPQDLDERRPAFRDQLLKVFGPSGSATRAENNLFTLLQSASLKDLPYIYFACGSADDFLPVNRDLAAQLSSRSAAYEYRETVGGHTWDYWDASLPDLLQAVVSAVSDQHHSATQ
ncbi:MAG: alpha/beta hydrolase family protein [Terriglobales bacterium]